MNWGCDVPSRTGLWGSREVLPACGCCFCTRCDGRGFGLWAMSAPQRQGMPSFIYQFSFSKRTSLISHIPRCGDVSSLRTVMLHPILLTCLGSVSLKQNLSQWERYRITLLRRIFLSIPLLPWKSRLVLYSELSELYFPLERSIFQTPRCTFFFFLMAGNFYTDSSLGKKREGIKCYSLYSFTPDTTASVTLDHMIFGFCTTEWKTDFLTASPKPISINNPNNKSKKDSSTPSLIRIACVCCALLDIIFLLCLIQKHLFFFPSFILLH